MICGIFLLRTFNWSNTPCQYIKRPMNLKKPLVLSLLAISFSVTACSKSKPNTTQSPLNAPAADPKNVKPSQQPSPTPTPFWTPSPTPSVTPTPSPTCTPSATPVSVATPTPVAKTSTPTPTPVPVPTEVGSNIKITSDYPESIQIHLIGTDAALLYRSLNLKAEANTEDSAPKGEMKKVGHHFTCYEDSNIVHHCLFSFSQPEGWALTDRRLHKLLKATPSIKAAQKEGIFAHVLSIHDKAGFNATLNLQDQIARELYQNTDIDFSGESTSPDFRLITTPQNRNPHFTFVILIDLDTGSVVHPPEND